MSMAPGQIASPLADARGCIGRRSFGRIWPICLTCDRAEKGGPQMQPPAVSQAGQVSCVGWCAHGAMVRPSAPQHTP